MRRRTAARVFRTILASGLLATASGQGTGQSSQAPLPRFGIAASVGTLGVGVEGATALARRVNVRGGFNFFRYSLSGTTSDNLTYNGTLHLQSGEALVDYYLAGPLHLSGGALFYDGFQGTGSVSVPGGHSLTLNGFTYYSSPTDPVSGTGNISARKFAPLALFGFGNLLPRSQRHFSANVDLGVAFQGSPNATLNLMGSTCATATTGCAPISTQPTVQANVTAEQLKINKDLNPFSFYPVIRMSFGYKF